MASQPFQLPLPLIPKLRYSGDNFVVHSGVRDVLTRILADNWTSSSNRCFLVFGAPRAGKTHLCVKLVDELGRSVAPHFADGSELERWTVDGLSLGRGDYLIVDNAEMYLGGLQNSGGFVNLCEMAKQREFKLVLVFGTELEGLSCDAHVMSRLRAASQGVIQHPSADDMEALIRAMGRQHGFALTAGRVKFIARRIGTTISEVGDYFERVRHLAAVLGRKVTPSLLSDAV
jgi:chromosomal replication initiation ATPase DnaA